MANMRVWIHDVPQENLGIADIGAKNLGR